MDILDLIHDATKEANSFENHPGKELPMEQRLLYLNGLSLVMNSDAEIDEDEKEYLRILIKSFELDESCLNDMVAFAQSPDKDTIQAFFRTFRRKPLAQLFLFDAYMMGMRDGEFHEKEKAVIDKIAEQLEVLKGTKKDVFDLFCFIKNKDWEESSLYFSSHLLNPEYFMHLLYYYEVSIDELVDRCERANKEKLYKKIIEPVVGPVTWMKTQYDSQINISSEWQFKYSEITEEFVSLNISYRVVIPYLQALHDRGELKVHNDKIYKSNKIYFFLSDGDARFDPLSRTFFIGSSDEEDFALGLTDDLILDIFNLTGVCITYGERGRRDLSRYDFYGVFAPKPYSNDEYLLGYDGNLYYGFGRNTRIAYKEGEPDFMSDLKLVDIIKTGKTRLMR